jgi:hypothetical protein
MLLFFFSSLIGGHHINVSDDDRLPPRYSRDRHRARRILAEFNPSDTLVDCFQKIVYLTRPTPLSHHAKFSPQPASMLLASNHASLQTPPATDADLCKPRSSLELSPTPSSLPCSGAPL